MPPTTPDHRVVRGRIHHYFAPTHLLQVEMDQSQPAHLGKNLVVQCLPSQLNGIDLTKNVLLMVRNVDGDWVCEQIRNL